MDLNPEVARDIERYVGETPHTTPKAMGAYEGANQFDKTLALWQPPLQSADADLLPEKGNLDAKVRDISRNDGYVQAGATMHRDNIVGSMYMLNSKPEWSYLKLDESWAEDAQQEIETKFTLAAESPRHWFDAAERNTLTGLVRLAVGVYAAGGGEVLATAEWIRETRRPFRTAIQMVDTDRLSTPYEHMADQFVRGGVRMNKRGAPLGYYIRAAHPSDIDRLDRTMRWKYVPVRTPWGRQQVIHLHEQTRIDQTRGVAAMVAGLKELRITKRFRDITLQNAVVNAMYAATIESELPPETAMASFGGGNVGSAAIEYAQQYLGAIRQYTSNAKHLQIDGVKIPHMFPGTKLNLRPAGTPGGVGQDFEQGLLRYIAALLGVSYEQLSRDWSKTNYSSARAGMLETWKFMQSRKKMVADRFATLIYMLWFEEQANAGTLECLNYSKAPNIYDGLNLEAYCSCDWIGAARGQIDELKETQAAVLRIKNNLSTHEDELAKLGKDWRKVFAQKERENTDMEARGLVMEETNQMNAASGNVREQDDEDKQEDRQAA